MGPELSGIFFSRSGILFGFPVLSVFLCCLQETAISTAQLNVICNILELELFIFRGTCNILVPQLFMLHGIFNPLVLGIYLLFF